MGVLKRHDGPRCGGHLDIAGAVTITVSLALAIYAVTDMNGEGSSPLHSGLLLGGAAVLAALFVFIEARAPEPLMPLGLLRERNLVVASIVGMFWASALYDWFFNGALYLQLVCKLSPLQVGLAFLPQIWLQRCCRYGLRRR